MGIFSAARCWWMFRTMGWDDNNVAVLDGGFSKVAEDFPELIIEGKVADDDMSSVPEEEARRIAKLLESNHQFRQELVRSVDQIERNLKEPQEQVVDARPLGRFNGTDPEPRAGLSSGHMPHSVSLPFSDVLAKGCMRSPEEIRTLYLDRGIDIHASTGSTIISSCGSGVSAAVIDLALTSASKLPG